LSPRQARPAELVCADASTPVVETLPAPSTRAGSAPKSGAGELRSGIIDSSTPPKKVSDRASRRSGRPARFHNDLPAQSS